MESFFNADLSDVRVHVGPQAKSIGALAFTMGSQLHFAPGYYNPHTSHGQRLLGHELAHVVEQRGGRVRNPFGNGVAVVQDPGLEVEAERMGMRAAVHQVQTTNTASLRSHQWHQKADRTEARRRGQRQQRAATAQMRRAGARVIQRDEWTKDTWFWWGHKSSKVSGTEFQQADKMSCWAASLSIASKILGVDLSEAWWLEVATEENVKASGKRGIEPAWWVALAEVIGYFAQGFSMTVKVWKTPQDVSGALKDGSVVLLHSLDHIVVLSALGLESTTNEIKLRVSDPAKGTYKTWDEGDLKAFDPKVVSILTRKEWKPTGTLYSL